MSQDSGLGRGVNEGKGDPECEPLVMGWERKRGSECPVKGGSGSKNRIHCTNDHRWVFHAYGDPPTKMLAEALWVMG